MDLNSCNKFSLFFSNLESCRVPILSMYPKCLKKDKFLHHSSLTCVYFMAEIKCNLSFCRSLTFKVYDGWTAMCRFSFELPTIYSPLSFEELKFESACVPEFPADEWGRKVGI